MAILKSGTKAVKSGQYEIVGPRGGKTGKERTVTRGEPLPPTPKIGQGYQLVDKTKHYHGLSAKRTDWKVKGMEHKHGQTVADEFRGCKNRAQLMREKYGDDFYLQDRPRKHRYIYVVGSKSFKKMLIKK